jgi:guanylate kinase
VNPFAVVISAPSGGGKTTVTRELMTHRGDVGYSVSCTTRAPRAGERNGIDYHFVSEAEFAAKRERGEFAESATVHGRSYGTLKSEVQRVLDEGRHVLMDIDVQGAAQFMVAYPSSVTVFVLPPSVDVLLERLVDRQTESAASLLTRLRSARAELAEVDRYHYVVVNDDLERTVGRISSIIDAEEVRRERVRALDAQVARLATRLEQEINEYSQHA